MSINHILDISLNIKIEDVTFVSGEGIFEPILNVDKICTYLNCLPNKLRKIFVFVLDIPNSLRQINRSRLSNIVPLEIRVINTRTDIIPIIPATIIKGLIRYAYDLYNVVEITNCYDTERVAFEILREIVSLDKKTVGSLIEIVRNFFSGLLDTDKSLSAFIDLFLDGREIDQNISATNSEEILYTFLLSCILSLQSHNSCLSVFDNISCSLPLSRELIRIRELLGERLSKLYKFTLCKSCLVFGCKGYESPLIFTNAKPRDENDIKLIVRTFNQICQHGGKQVIAKTGPYTLIGFDKNIYFNSKILLRYSSLYRIANKISIRDHGVKYIDLVIEALEKSIETLSRGLLDCVIALGRRGSIGYGKAHITIKIS